MRVEKQKILRVEIGAEDDEIIVGFVGRLTEIKNIPLLLKAAGLYQEKRNSGFPEIKVCHHRRRKPAADSGKGN